MKEITLTKEESEKLRHDSYVFIERDGYKFLVKKGIIEFISQHHEALTAFLINNIKE